MHVLLRFLYASVFTSTHILITLVVCSSAYRLRKVRRRELRPEIISPKAPRTSLCLPPNPKITPEMRETSSPKSRASGFQTAWREHQQPGSRLWPQDLPGNLSVCSTILLYICMSLSSSKSINSEFCDA